MSKQWAPYSILYNYILLVLLQVIILTWNMGTVMLSILLLGRVYGFTPDLSLN